LVIPADSPTTLFPYTTLFRSELQAEIAGVVTEVLIREGDSVRKGDVLLRIDPVQTEAETRAQEALLEASLAEARSQKAQISLQKDRKSTRLNSSHVKISYAVF